MGTANSKIAVLATKVRFTAPKLTETPKFTLNTRSFTSKAMHSNSSKSQTPKAAHRQAEDWSSALFTISNFTNCGS